MYILGWKIFFVKNIKLDQANIEPQGHTQLLMQLLMPDAVADAVADTFADAVVDAVADAVLLTQLMLMQFLLT